MKIVKYAFVLLLLCIAITSVDAADNFSFCDNGENGTSLEIKDISIENANGDDDEWTLLDRITVEVEVENDGDNDIDDVIVELGLFDDDDDNIANDLTYSNRDEEEIEVGDLDENDDEVAVFRFTVPADTDEGDYKLRVKVYSDDLGESAECSHTSSDLSDDNFEEIEIEQESEEGKFITFDKILVSPEKPFCGEQVTISARVVNVGDDSQGRTRVVLESRDLDFIQTHEITDEIDEGESESVSFSFTLPDDLPRGSYFLDLSAEYDYQNGIYRERTDQKTRFTLEALACLAGSGLGGGVLQEPTVSVRPVAFDDSDDFDSDFDDDSDDQDRKTITGQATGSLYDDYFNDPFIVAVMVITVMLGILTLVILILILFRI